MSDDYYHAADHKPVVERERCWSCYDMPSGANDPCEVCGKSFVVEPQQACAACGRHREFHRDYDGACPLFDGDDSVGWLASAFSLVEPQQPACVTDEIAALRAELAEYREDWRASIEQTRKERARAVRAEAERDEARAERDRLEVAVCEEIGTRDRYAELLDQFAYAVASIEVIGEHSSANCPWENALELVTPHADVERMRGVVEQLCRVIMDKSGGGLKTIDDTIEWVTGVPSTYRAASSEQDGFAKTEKAPSEQEWPNGPWPDEQACTDATCESLGHRIGAPCIEGCRSDTVDPITATEHQEGDDACKPCPVCVGTKYEGECGWIVSGDAKCEAYDA